MDVQVVSMFKEHSYIVRVGKRSKPKLLYILYMHILWARYQICCTRNKGMSMILLDVIMGDRLSDLWIC